MHIVSDLHPRPCRSVPMPVPMPVPVPVVVAVVSAVMMVKGGC